MSALLGGTSVVVNSFRTMALEHGYVVRSLSEPGTPEYRTAGTFTIDFGEAPSTSAARRICFCLINVERITHAATFASHKRHRGRCWSTLILGRSSRTVISRSTVDETEKDAGKGHCSWVIAVIDMVFRAYRPGSRHSLRVQT